MISRLFSTLTGLIYVFLYTVLFVLLLIASALQFTPTTTTSRDTTSSSSYPTKAETEEVALMEAETIAVPQHEYDVVLGKALRQCLQFPKRNIFPTTTPPQPPPQAQQQQQQQQGNAIIRISFKVSRNSMHLMKWWWAQKTHTI